MITINAILLKRDRESGVERCIRGLIEALAVHGTLNYQVWARAGAGLDALAGTRMQVMTPPYPLRSRVARILWEQAVLPRRLRSSPSAVLHAPGYVAPWLAPRPIVLTVYDLVAIRFPQWAARGNQRHYRLMLPRSLRRAAAVITPSGFVRDEIRQHYNLPAARFHVIPPAIDHVFFTPPDTASVERIRRHYDLPPRYLLAVGNIEPKKNFEGLVQAYAALCRDRPATPDLVIAGRPAWKSAGFFDVLNASGVSARVRCLGRVPDDTLRSLYHHAAMLVQPSWYEGFGIPPLEAMACGIPVIASSGGALAETVGDAALRVAPGDHDALCRAIDGLLTDTGLRQRLVDRGHRHARRFTPQAVAAAHDTVYRRILSGHGDKP